MLTCLGTTFVGRVAGSLLKATGLQELITSSLEEYEASALKLAHDPSYLASIKNKLVHNRNRCPLFNTERVTRQIEVCLHDDVGTISTRTDASSCRRSFEAYPDRITARRTCRVTPEGWWRYLRLPSW